MSQYQIAVVVGSLRRDSFNRKLATAVVKLGPPEFSFRQVQIGDLPLFVPLSPIARRVPSTGY
jgi:chromate reductase, NAD(P)H dehydrogenase (quinone)